MYGFMFGIKVHEDMLGVESVRKDFPDYFFPPRAGSKIALIGIPLLVFGVDALNTPAFDFYSISDINEAFAEIDNTEEMEAFKTIMDYLKAINSYIIVLPQIYFMTGKED